MNPEKRREIFRRLQAANPDPTTELHYRTPYELLVAVVLSAQATDKSVNQATAELFPKAEILVTGVDDPQSGPHGPDEGLHLAEFERVCLAETLFLSKLAG